MKVYIVVSGYYSDYSIEKVFLDKNKADLFVKYNSNCRIEEFDTSDDYEPKDAYFKCTGVFKIIAEKDVYHPNGFYRSVFESYDCNYYDNINNTITTDLNYYVYKTLKIVRYYKVSDYGGLESIMQEKIAKIGFDLCSEIIDMLNDGASDLQIGQVIEDK